MAIDSIQIATPSARNPLQFFSLGLMALAILVAIFFMGYTSDYLESYPYLFLLPWVIALGAVISTPSVILYYRGKFSFADPLVFATWSYFFPAFVIGGVMFSVGLSKPHFISLIQDAKETLPLTIILIGLGFTGLSIGYFLPLGAKIGSLIGDKLPVTDYPSRSFAVPGVVLLVLGVIISVAAFSIGIFGYQKNDEMSSYDGIIFLTTLFWMQASFLLWYIIFRQRKIDVFYIPVLALLVSTSLLKALYSGSRGSVLSIFTIIALAYILAGRRFKLKQMTFASGLLAVGLICGMIYGSTFRQIKGTESDQSADLYSENILRTFDQVGRSDLSESLDFGFSNFAERIDLVSTVAVVVSSYEQLKPYEEAYGLDNNIWIDTTTFFIPRVFWTDKPSASDPRKYSDLYFNYGDSSYAITPIGDLLRNYGIIGVPIGMFILGIIIRLIYRALVEGQKPSVWRITFYFMLLMSVSYEGFYGTIIPNFFKYGFTALLGIVIVNFMAKRFDSRSNSQLTV